MLRDSVSPILHMLFLDLYFMCFFLAFCNQVWELTGCFPINIDIHFPQMHSVYSSELFSLIIQNLAKNLLLFFILEITDPCPL